MLQCQSKRKIVEIGNVKEKYKKEKKKRHEKGKEKGKGKREKGREKVKEKEKRKGKQEIHSGTHQLKFLAVPLLLRAIGTQVVCVYVMQLKESE